MPHNYIIAVDVDGDDIWVGTAKGLGWGIGEGYYPGLKQRALSVRAAGAGTRGGSHARRPAVFALLAFALGCIALALSRRRRGVDGRRTPRAASSSPTTRRSSRC